MMQFTFNTLERVGILDRIYAFVANLANRHLLSRHNFDTEYIAGVFNALDGFWLKYGRMEQYGNSEVRVIAGTVIEALRDNTLTADEVRKLTRYVTSRWSPDIAETKTTTPLDTLLPPAVEEVAKRSVDLYKQLPPHQVRAEDFVAVGAGIISDKLGESDSSIVHAMLGALKAR